MVKYVEQPLEFYLNECAKYGEVFSPINKEIIFYRHYIENKHATNAGDTVGLSHTTLAVMLITSFCITVAVGTAQGQNEWFQILDPKEKSQDSTVTPATTETQMVVYSPTWNRQTEQTVETFSKAIFGEWRQMVETTGAMIFGESAMEALSHLQQSAEAATAALHSGVESLTHKYESIMQATEESMEKSWYDVISEALEPEADYNPATETAPIAAAVFSAYAFKKNYKKENLPKLYVDNCYTRCRRDGGVDVHCTRYCDDQYYYDHFDEIQLMMNCDAQCAETDDPDTCRAICYTLLLNGATITKYALIFSTIVFVIVCLFMKKLWLSWLLSTIAYWVTWVWMFNYSTQWWERQFDVGDEEDIYTRDGLFAGFRTEVDSGCMADDTRNRKCPGTLTVKSGKNRRYGNIIEFEDRNWLYQQLNEVSSSYTSIAIDHSVKDLRRIHVSIKNAVGERMNVFLYDENGQERLEELDNMLELVPDKDLMAVIPEYVKEDEPIEDTPEENVPTDFDAWSAQLVLDELRNGPNYRFSEVDDLMVYSSAIDPPGNYRYNPTRGLFFDKEEKECLVPLLNSTHPRRARHNQVDTLLSLGSRNLAKPQLQGSVSARLEAVAMVDSYFDAYIDETKLPWYCNNVSEASVYDWYRDTQSFNLNVLEDATSIINDFERWMFSLKADPKPNLTELAPYKFQRVQTLVYNDKFMNSLCSPIWREIANVTRRALKGGVFIANNYSDKELERMINERGDKPFIIFKGDDSAFVNEHGSFENDFSKFDKSQEDIALQTDLEWLFRFRVPVSIIKMWCKTHLVTLVWDPNIGLVVQTAYKRNSGDASTLTGNNNINLGAHAVIYNVGAFLAGSVDVLKDKSGEMQRRYNLECKLLNFKHCYFASNFIVKVREKWRIVPDPIKILVRMGRPDIMVDKLPEVHMSFTNRVHMYGDYELCQVVADAVAERYHLKTDCTDLFNTFVALRKFENFAALFL